VTLEFARVFGSRNLNSILVIPRTLIERTVTAEAAGSSPVVPAIHFKAVIPIFNHPGREKHEVAPSLRPLPSVTLCCHYLSASLSGERAVRSR
jgi:hypothetical protein